MSQQHIRQEIDEEEQEQPFYIPATIPGLRAQRVLKHGDTFAVLDAHGDVGVAADGADGVFHKDTRHLSRMELLLNGMQPLLLGSNLRDDNAVLNVDLTNPDGYFESRLFLPKDTLHIRRTIFLWRGSVYERVGISNHGAHKVRTHLSWSFASDFADVFEVRGMRREHRGTVRTHVERAQAVLAYMGLDGVERRTALMFDPRPTFLDEGIATYAIDLSPGDRASVFLVVECEPNPRSHPMPVLSGMHAAFREIKSLGRDAARVETSNEVFNQVIARSVADLAMLMTSTPQGQYPYAGIPWYSTTFGRDGLITALLTLWCDPRIARGVLLRLAAYQSTVDDPAKDAQPGKILHEMRAGEMATLHEIPFGCYYGSVDSTPLFVLLAGRYAERTGDLGVLRKLWPHIQAALHWIDGPGDPDGDGFVEYHHATDQGLANQGWKDSQDSVFHADGRLAQGKIALVEVQGYVYAAKRAIARVARMLGEVDTARTLEHQADALAERFEKAFWCPEIDLYALALDGEKRQCAVRTSNAGQVLFTGIAQPVRARSVGRQLLGPSFFSGWGIRTVANDQPRYNPMSYHDGSVWPHDNALIALGLGRCGLQAEVERVFSGLFDAACYMDFRRLPELFCGFRRVRGQGPTLYPVACSPQAWSCVTPFALLEASLGLEFDPALQEIRLRNPRLPSFLEEVNLANLRLGGSRLDLSIRRHSGDLSLQVTRSDGQVRVSAVYT